MSSSYDDALLLFSVSSLCVKRCPIHVSLQRTDRSRRHAKRITYLFAFRLFMSVFHAHSRNSFSERCVTKCIRSSSSLEKITFMSRSIFGSLIFLLHLMHVPLFVTAKITLNYNCRSCTQFIKMIKFIQVKKIQIRSNWTKMEFIWCTALDNPLQLSVDYLPLSPWRASVCVADAKEMKSNVASCCLRFYRLVNLVHV